MKKELYSTYLVQRLNHPQKYDNPFDFGCGLKNGGLSGTAMKLLKPIFSFDYMGSAEFEFGALPKSLESIVSNIKEYTSFTTIIKETPVYVLCRSDNKEEIIKRLLELAENKIRCKESTNFDIAVGNSNYRKKEDCRTIGWLELNNNFIFFTDKEAANKLVNLIEVKDNFDTK